MDNKTISLEYANSLIFELEKAFYDERGKGARFRLTTLGRGFYQECVRPRIAADSIDSILVAVQQAVTEAGIVSEVSYLQEERLIRVQFKGCIHCPADERMVATRGEPLACMPANLIVLAIEEKLDKPVELAEIRMENGVCSVMLIIFESRPNLA
jgi:hypothetical protein